MKDFLSKGANLIEQINLAELVQSQNLTLVDSATANLNDFIFMLKIISVILVIYFIVSFAITAYFFWNRLSKQKKSFILFLKFLVADFVLLSLLFTIWFSMILNSDSVNQFLFVFVTILFFDLFLTMHSLFAINGNFTKVFENLFRVLKKIPKLIIPAFVVFLGLTLIFACIWLTAFFIFESYAALVAIFCFCLIVLCFLWIKVYWFKSLNLLLK